MNSRFASFSTFCTVLCLSVLSIVLPQSAFAKTKSKSISHTLSYQVFTQKKGQSLKQAIKATKLSAVQKKLILSLPIIKTPQTDRQFHLGFVKQKGQSLLREIQVIRGKNRANYIIALKKGKVITKSVKTVPNPRKLMTQKQSVRVVKPVNSVKKVVTTSITTKKFVQKKGQSVASALKKQNLNSTQKQLILSLPISKIAKSDRTFHLSFEKAKGKALLRKIKATRGNSSAEYRIEVQQGKPVAINETTGKRVATAKVSNKKSTSVPLGNERIVRFSQRKGQSLYSAMKKSGLSSLQKKLISSAPFSKSASSRRQFYVLVERVGKKRLMRSFKVIRGKSSAEYAVVSHKGKTTVADRNGNIKSANSSGMLRYPLSFSHVSSHFTYRRFHPILRRYRKHTGTDFAARKGTKVWAPANGVVTFKGRQRGYGNTIVISHGRGYKTKYAHLSRYAKGLRVGKRVRKKQIIAYVGNTGRSTGPHLHYEVIVNGKPRNPLRVRLPGGRGASKAIRTKNTVLTAKRYLGKLNNLLARPSKRETQVARKGK